MSKHANRRNRNTDDAEQRAPRDSKRTVHAKARDCDRKAQRKVKRAIQGR